MKIIVATVFLALAPALALAHGDAPPTPAPQANAAIAEPAKVIDAFHDALTKGDRAAALNLLDDDVQIYEQGWVERSKAEYAAHHLANDAEFSAATKHSTTTRSGMVLGDMAYVISEGRVTGAFKGKAVDSITLETMTLRRAKNGWRIVHIHWSSRATKVAAVAG